VCENEQLFQCFFNKYRPLIKSNDFFLRFTNEELASSHVKKKKREIMWKIWPLRAKLPQSKSANKHAQTGRKEASHSSSS
jgi:hypothetical protein